MRYEPGASPPVDFSWEREWRVRVDELEISPPVATVLVRDSRWADRLLGEHEHEQNRMVEELGLVLDQSLAQMHRESFPWKLEWAE